MFRKGTHAGILLIALVALLVAGPAVLAQEVRDPTVGQLADAVEQVAGSGGGSGGGGGPPTAAPAAVPSAPTQDDDSGAHETSDPQEPDHAGGSVVDLDVAGEDAVDVGSTDARVEDDGGASGDVTVLAIGGNEIIGAHSDSRDGPESDSVAPFDGVCEGSGGALCVGLLFADTSSSESGGKSTAESDAALAFACIGGEQTDSDASCDGEVAAGVATSNSEVTQDDTGATTAEQETALADVCVGGEDAQSGACEGVGLEVMRSESQSQAASEDGDGSTSNASCTADLQAGGSANCLIEDPQALEVPPGCPAGESLVCLYLNQGEAFVFTGGAGSHQEAVHVSLLSGAVDGSDLVTLHLSDAETLAGNNGVSAAGVEAPGAVLGSGGGAPAVGAGAVGPELAFTGLPAVALLGSVLLLIGAGLSILALERRRAAAVT